MPIYLYSNPKDENEVEEVIQSVHDEHVYSKDGVKWTRVFTVPTASVDSKWDENNPQDFVEKSKGKKGTIGNLMEKSAELSAKRKKRYGKDKFKEQFYSDYKKNHSGKDHPDVKKKKLKKILEKTHLSWEG